jgi:hypothetical protein
MKKLGTKGQMVNAYGVVGILVLILVIGYVSITGLSLNQSAADSMGSDLTGENLAVKNNITTKIAKAYGQSSNLPYIYVAVLMIAAILSILGYLKFYGG